MKRVSAETITEITSAAGFFDPAHPPSPATPPSVEDICDMIRADLKQRLEDTRAREAAGQPPVKYAPTAAQLEKQQQEFEELIKDIPEGFALAPVLYSRISREENAEIHSEYQFIARPRFLRFLGENHADDLRALGIAEHGIERMKNGLDPADENGKMYDVNIDHITERAGSGLWGKSKEVDPDQPDGPAVSHANHFGNFILLPKQVHEYKNKLNDIQHITRTEPGECMWTIMIVPERNDLHAGFVCQPQPDGHVYSGLARRKDEAQNQINHGIFLFSTVAEEIAQVSKTPGLSTVLVDFKKAAAQEGKSVSKAANDDIRDNKAPGLRRLFNDAVSKYPEAQRDLDTLVRPGLVDTASHMGKLFDRVAKNRHNGKRGREAWERFVRTMKGRNMRDFREKAESLPLRESTDLYFALRRIDMGIRDARQQDGIGKVQPGQPANANGQQPWQKKQDAKQDKNRGKGKKKHRRHGG